MTDKRVGLIGFGLAGATFHAPLIAATPGLRLSAIVTSNAERRRKAEREHPDVRLLSDVDELWNSASELDLVVVASPNGIHFAHASSALAAGLSVVVDKPFAANAADGQTLVDEARGRGLMIAPFHNRRWDGDFLTVRRLIDEGRLGEIVRFESRFERWRVVPKPRWMEPGAVAAAEGMTYDLLSHLIDQALVLFGPVSHVYAEADRRRAGVQVDDDAYVALTHRSGVRSHVKGTIVAGQIGPRFAVYGSRAAYFKSGVDPQEDMLKAGRRPGEGGWAVEPPALWGTIGEGDAVSPVRTEPGAYERFYAGVAAALRDEAPPPVDPNDAVAGLEIIEAAYRSAAENRVINL